MGVTAPSSWPWPFRYILFLGLFILAHAGGVLVASGLLLGAGDGGVIGGATAGPPPLLLVAMLAALPSCAVTLLLWRGLERGTLEEIGLGGGARAWRGLLGGFVLGIALLGVIALPALAAGWSERIWLPEGAAGFARTVALCLPGFLLVALGEEVAFRGYLYRGLARHVARGAALAVSSCLFAALHLNNPNITPLGAVNIALAGFVLGGVARAAGHLAWPIGVHAGWNFALGTLVGLPVSGVEAAGLLRLPIRGPAWWTGGTFGPEGSVAATLVLLAALVGAWTIWRRRESGAGPPHSLAGAEDPTHQDDDAGQQHQ